MLKEYGIKENKIIKIPVIATMSSGKSTLINALIGKDVLPSENKACTSKILPIVDTDKSKNFHAIVKYKSGDIENIELKGKEVSELNNNADIEALLIKGNITGVRNYRKQIVIYDTPGTNYSEDLSHRDITYDFISKLKSGLILYIINGTQFGINDDKELLNHVIDKVNNSNGKINVLYIVNKIDEFDIEKENVDATMKEIEQYLTINGAKNIKMLPISALAAKIFKKVLSEENLTRREVRDFKNYYSLFKAKGYDLTKYSYNKWYEKIEINGDEFQKSEILHALRSTGINLIEDYIDDYLKLNDGSYKSFS